MSRIWTFLRREPLVHFTVLATLLFLANAVWSDAGREVIRLDLTTQKSLFKQREDLLLRPLTAEERNEVIASYIEDEILWHEARRRGLDSTSRIRRQLVQGMRFLLLGDVSPPNEKELRAFYEKNPTRFELPPALTLDHVFFSDPNAVPEDILDALHGGAVPETLSEFNMTLGPIIPWAGQERLVQLFGPDSARVILSIEDKRWHGPIASNRGVHFVRVAERHPPRVPAFEDIMPYLEGDWTIDRQRVILNQELASMRQSYRIIIEGNIGTGG